MLNYASPRSMFIVTVLTSFWVVVFINLFPLTSFFVTPWFVDAFGWLYGDIARDCGDWCHRMTLVGLLLQWIILFVFALATQILLRRVRALQQHLYVRTTISILVAFILLFGWMVVADLVPNVPTSVRCVSFTYNENLRSGSFAYGVEGPRTECLLDLATQDKSLDTCLRINDSFFRKLCVTSVAEQGVEGDECLALEDGELRIICTKIFVESI